MLWAGCVLTALVSGCAGWDRAKPSPAAGNASLCLIFVYVPDEQASELASVWDKMQPPAMAAGLQTHLRANGFRVGVARGAAPPPLGEWIAKSDPRVTANPPIPASPGLRLVAKPPGEPRRCTVMYRDAFGVVSGNDFPNARAVLGIRCLDLDPTHVRLRLVPEVHYRRDARPTQATRRIRPRRARLHINRYDDLSWEVTLPPGAHLLVGCDVTRSLSMAGQILLTERQGKTYVGVLVVRVGTGAAFVPHPKATGKP